MNNGFATAFGAVLLACGVCSPAAGSVNAHCSELVFFGLAILVSAIYADYQKDKKDARG